MVKGRITVVSTIYHQPVSGQPTSVDSTYMRTLQTDEQPYVRQRVKVGPDWQPLDLGWLDRVSMIHVTNEEGQFTQTQPTPQERAEALAKVVEIGLYIIGPDSQPFALVHPGQAERLTPADVGSLRLRCVSGEACCTITLFPA